MAEFFCTVELYNWQLFLLSAFFYIVGILVGHLERKFRK